MRTVHLLAVALATAACFAVAETVSADVQTLGPGRDNTVFMDPLGGLSNGAGPAMFAGRNAAPSNSVRRGLLWFDVAAAVPAGATITGVTLRLHNSAANQQPSSVALRRVLEDWGEGTSLGGGSGGGNGGPATPGDATWLYRMYPATPWAAPGGTYGDVLAATVVSESGFYDWASAALVAEVQAALDSPGANFGWMLIGDESAASTAKRFATREETLVDRRPMLTIEYTSVPAPSGAAAAIAGFLMMSARRQRR